MIKEETVFILGAGASCPYGFPTGEELRAEIIKHHVNDYKTWLDKNITGDKKIPIYQQLAEASRFVDAFSKSSTRSIDLFLSRRPEFKDQGKMAIAFRILHAEQNSKFREDIEDKQKDWYSQIFEELTKGMVNSSVYIRFFLQNKVSFITFNYDRSLEQFLYESLINSFGSITSGFVNVLHVFGQVAPLPWQDIDQGLNYRTPVASIDINKFKDNIHTIYEEKGSNELEDDDLHISDANRIYFLGFGYAKENLSLLKIPDCLRGEQKIYGTALGSTEKERKYFRELLTVGGGVDKNDVFICDWDCRQLLREYL